jgi:phenylacetate-CoA ligase
MFTIFNPELGQTAERVLSMNRQYFAGEWTEEKLQQYQLEQAKATLRYVKEHSPFYGRRLEAWSVEQLDALDWDSFRRLPFTDKQDLRDAMYDMLSKPVEQACFFYETTGTTGAATPCPRDYIDSIYSNTPVTLCYETILKKGKPHVVGVCGPTELHSFGDSLGDVCKNLGLAMAKMWPHSPVVGYKKALEMLQKLKISVLMCTPGMALSLAKAAQQMNLDVKKDMHVDILMLTGELGTRSMMRNIESIWGAKAYNFLYGSQETLVLSAVADDDKMHTFPLNYIYEVIDPQTLQPVATSGGILEGELVVTMLFRGSKPLVRYRTGDMVRIRAHAPSDVFVSPTIEVLGRNRDRIGLNGQMIMAYDLEETLMASLTECLGYQLTIEEEAGRDRLKIELEMSDKSKQTGELLAKVADVFKSKFGTNTEVSFESLGAIGSTGAMVSWKAARIIDKRSAGVDPEKAAAMQIASTREAAQ